MIPDENELIHRYLSGAASDEEIEQLDDLLATRPETREQFLFAVETDTELRAIALEEAAATAAASEALPMAASKRSLRLLPVAVFALAAVLSLAALVAKMVSRETPPIADLVSAEGASWESDLPTAPGSSLGAGYLKLRSGVALIRFRSGAEVRLEAPAHFVLETPMKGQLLAGAVIVDVPDAALGFVIETPGSFAVDHGTSFAVAVDSSSGASAYEVLSGEISVHSSTGELGRLKDSEALLVGEDGLVAEATLPAENGVLPEKRTEWRLGTDGRERTLIRDGKLSDRVHPHFLMAKRGSVLPGYDRRSVFSFDLASLEDRQTAGDVEVQLRLNLVPCGLGFAARLPEVSEFALYGIDSSWDAVSADWDEAPRPEMGERLGEFSIPRSQTEGSFTIETEALARFVSERSGGEATFLLVRETEERLGNGLVHAFASSLHPKTAGPTLTLR